MCCIIALIIGFSIDSWKSSNQSFFCHRFYISIDRRTSDLRLFFPHFLIDIVRRKMLAFAGITDNVTVLVFAHEKYMRISRIMRNFPEKSISFWICFCFFFQKFILNSLFFLPFYVSFSPFFIDLSRLFLFLHSDRNKYSRECPVVSIRYQSSFIHL